MAQTPLATRDQARLLVRESGGALRHRRVVDLTSELPAGTLLILNDTKVFPSRLIGRLETGGQVELFLIRAKDTDPTGTLWSALARPMKKLKEGRTLIFDAGITANIVAKHEDAAGNPTVDVRFNADPETLARWIDQQGYIPLPPYIKRPKAEKAPVSVDRESYQTVFARERGSVAAPTAGLHFTDNLLAALRVRGVEVATVALHVGAGTFLPVKAEHLGEHKMHSETYNVPKSTVAALLKARAEKRLVVAVGTTSLRSLEDLYRRAGGQPEAMLDLADSWQSTELFLYPKTRTETIRPWVIDGLFTNFHQPHSTLFMLVSALLGLDTIQALYKEAIAEEYRLYSYGDASLLWLS